MSLWNEGRPPEILLAEGDPDIAALMKFYLERKEAKINVASTGKQAIEFCSLTKYDVIILDVELPDMEGLKVLQHLRQSGNDAPVLFLTYSTFAP